MKNNLALPMGTFSLIMLIGVLTGIMFGGEAPKPQIQQDPPVISPALLEQAKSMDSVDYLIYFDEKADLSAAYEMDWEARGWYVYDTLRAHADETQANVRKYLEEQDVEYEPFWVQNVIAVKSSTSKTLNGLLDFYEIDSMEKVPVVFLEETVFPESSVADEEVAVEGAASNLLHINADDVWDMGYLGEGMVVGSIDSGARFSHEALLGTYRGNLGDGNIDHNFNWWDTVNGSDVAYDDHGHGSHTIGIMAGTDGDGNRIGVAPQADWIACKAISQTGSGLGWDFIKCGQFMIAPWDLNQDNADPNLRPNVVNNSWGGCSQTYFPWFEGTIDSWLAAGIYPVFSNGNASNCGYSTPPGLNTVSDPARSYHVTAVGSTGMDNGAYATHSNWGPTDSPDTINPNGYPNIKPQVVAPGVNIRSAVSSHDQAYASWGGTSMSAPHVAGLVALMWDAGACLTGDYAHTETLLQDSAVPIPYDTGNGDEGPGNVPNHATGWGEIDALAAVNAALEFCGTAYLEGHVYDSETGLPVSGAVVSAAAQDDPATGQTSVADTDGYYSLALASDEVYDLSVSGYGYQSSTLDSVSISTAGEIFVHDFMLEPISDEVALSGRITDGNGQGYPLYARILIETTGFSESVFTDPVNGTFEVSLFVDVPYDLIITSMIDGYQQLSETQIVFDEPVETRDYALNVSPECDAPGYKMQSGVCSTLQGGVLLGYVSDQISGEYLNGVTLSDGNVSAVTSTTSADPDVEDGFYWLFLPTADDTQNVRLSLSKWLYVRLVADAPVTQSEITAIDFSLESCQHKLWVVLQQFVAAIRDLFAA